MKGFLADTSYLLALYAPEEDSRNVKKAKCSFSGLFEQPQNELLMAWPVLYETLNTRLSRRKDVVEKIETEWRKLRATNQLTFVSDHPFREPSLDEWGKEVGRTGHYRPLSLVDRVLRNALLDRSRRIDALLTFNVRDFADICRKGDVRIIPDPVA